MSPDEIERIARGEHADPFARLGMHVEDGVLRIRAMLPTARRVGLVDTSAAAGAAARGAGAAGESGADDGRVLVWLEPIHPDGLYEASIPTRGEPFPYRLRVDWGPPADEGEPFEQEFEDPYRFGPLISEFDRSSNRVVIGLVTSALIVSSALVMRSGTTSLWITAPFFLLSGMLGLWLVYGILRSGLL